MESNKLIVCGLGPSLKLLSNPQDYTTIGVNDHYRVAGWHPDHLVLINRIEVFDKMPRRQKDILETKAGCVWSLQYFNHENFKEIELDCVSLYEPITNDKLNGEKILSFTTSPFSAVHLAYKLGAKEIGLLGVDLIGHKLNYHAETISEKFQQMERSLVAAGCSLCNLSPKTNLQGLRYVRLEDF